MFINENKEGQKKMYNSKIFDTIFAKCKKKVKIKESVVKISWQQLCIHECVKQSKEGETAEKDEENERKKKSSLIRQTKDNIVERCKRVAEFSMLMV